MLFSARDCLQSKFLAAMYGILLYDLVECLCGAMNTKNYHKIFGRVHSALARNFH